MPENQPKPATPAQLRSIIFLLAVSLLMLIASIGVVLAYGETSWCGGIAFGALFTIVTGRTAYRMHRDHIITKK